MAWTSAAHDGAAGRMITLLDNLLVAAHATWTVYDAAAGANAKVYRCLDAAADPPVDFYILVDDNQANFSKVYLYDSWDAIGHTYVKDTNCKVIYGAAGANVPYIAKLSGGYYFSSQDHRFIYIDKYEWEANYVGMLEYPPSFQRPFIQHPVIIASSTGYASGYNPLGRPYNSGTFIVGMAMMGAAGQGMATIRGKYYTAPTQYFICSDGGMALRPTWIYDSLHLPVLGRLKNVMVCYAYDPLNNDDTVTFGGNIWRYVEGTDSTRYACFVKQE